jgi:hypothetical protein
MRSEIQRIIIHQIIPSAKKREEMVSIVPMI